MPFARHAVPVDELAMSVVDDGPRDARETLLFLHGNPAWSFLWRRLLRAARDVGHRVVAPDLAGLGMSEKPLHAAYHTLDRHIRNVEAVVEARGLRDVTLVLHDWGGPIGMGLAVRRPRLVRRIVVTNSVAFAPRRRRAFSAWHRFFASPLGQVLGVNLNLVARSAFRHGVREPLPREVREAYLWPLRQRGARVAAASLVRMVPDGPEHPTAATLRELEAGYPGLQSTPMLVLWAGRDPVMPPRLADKWKERFPRAEVRHVAPGAGHFWQEDAPGAFQGPILGFVEEA